MTVLREVFARFGMQFDEQSFKRADAAVNGLRKGLAQGDAETRQQQEFAGSPAFRLTAGATARAPAARREATTVTQNQNNTFHIQAHDTDGVRREVRDVLNQEQRYAFELVTEASEAD